MQKATEVDGPLPIFGYRPHAHFAAVDIKVDFVRGEQVECMVQDRWDLHWQRTYSYDAPFERLPTLRRGDKVRIRCTYDNSMMNPRLGAEYREVGLPIADIYLGERSVDEMCMVDLLYLQKTRP